MKLLSNTIKSWWFPWVLGAVILRLLLAAITIHPDAFVLNFSGYLFSTKGIVNIYDYLMNLPNDSQWVGLYSRTFFTYPPLSYFTLGSFMYILKPFFNSGFMEWFINNPLSSSLGNPELFRHLLVFKIPYLFFDLGIAFLLYKIFEGKDGQKTIFKLWLFNPLTFYTSFMIAQFDIIPVFFVVLSLLLAMKDRKYLALLSLSIGASYKMFPLFFVPLFAFALGGNLKERIKLIIVGFVPYLITLLPFIFSPAFRQNVLFSNQSQKMLYMVWPLSGAEGLYVFVVSLFVIWFFAYYQRIVKEDLWKYMLLTLLLFFSVTHFHPQWFLWITPFLVFELAQNRFKHLFLIMILFGSWLFITLMFEASLSYGAFSPLWPQLDKAKSFSEILGARLDVFQLKSLVRSVFAAASIFITLDLFSKTEVKTK